jgi:polysaccharide export outer membrane protein
MFRALVFATPLLVILTTSGCSMKEYTLFQDENLSEEPTRIPDEQYKDEMVFENKIAPSDRVSVKVYNQAGAGVQQLTSMVGGGTAMSQNEGLGFLVTKEGTIRLPLIGSIRIEGMTEDQASDYLIEEYKKYLRKPYVTVKLENQRVYVLGEVQSPGMVPVYNGTVNLVEAIARSGDLTDFARRTNIKILRGDLRNPEVRTVDLTKMSSIRLSSLYLRPNDIVYVQPRTIKGYNIAFQQIAPPFHLISTLLQPFVSIIYTYKAIDEL